MFKIAALLTVVILLFASCTTDPLSPTVMVKYEITGSAGTVDVDYLDSNGKLAIINDVKIPWSLSFTADRGRAVLVSATNTAGTAKVAIYTDGNLLDDDSISGAGKATAEGTI